MRKERKDKQTMNRQSQLNKDSDSGPARKKKKGESDTFYRAFYPIPAFLFRLYAKTFCTFTSKPIRPGEQFIVVCNHLTERDFYMVCSLVRGHMYVVVSEHLFRQAKKWQTIVIHLMNPISRAKGATDIASVGEMMKRLRRGNSLMLFPEGHRSADGVTMEVGRSTGALIKKAGCMLITCRITGGFFAEPRWTHSVRKGELTAGIVGVYSADEIGAMSADQVADIVNRDIYEDAYARQEKDPKPYRGKNLAEGLENHLFLCPNCRGISTLQTEGDTFRCGQNCGMHGTYDEYGMLSGENLPFTTVRDWTRWQKTEFLKMCDETDGELTRDHGATLYRITIRKHESAVEDQGDVWADKEAMHVGDHVFRWTDISDTAFMSLGNTLYFQTKEGYFESYGAGIAQIKYQILWKKYKGGC